MLQYAFKIYGTKVQVVITILKQQFIKERKCLS